MQQKSKIGATLHLPTVNLVVQLPRDQVGCMVL